MLAILGGCSSVQDKITLLPDPDGSVGGVIVTSGKNKQVIDEPYARAEVKTNGTIEKAADNKSSVQTHYGDLLAAAPPRPQTFTINFVFDSATQLAPDSAATVAKLKAVLANWPAPRLMVVGHTDLAGSQEFNDQLSLRRAQSVASFLEKQGIPARQIEVAGRGKREPLVRTADGVPNQMNRRAVITIQ
ncbi:OmpA family protein [Paraburkholderia adhaesiva]|uniref:OmpA family protein n=1 Tax=Paraburkholderia adhaesiva TaxID=2883244 RepID=UPI001F4192C7|nr:OmpA family protein [Paraburkholderia adhaesiva]